MKTTRLFVCPFGIVRSLTGKNRRNQTGAIGSVLGSRFGSIALAIVALIASGFVWRGFSSGPGFRRESFPVVPCVLRASFTPVGGHADSIYAALLEHYSHKEVA